jgi:hypothetical protein
MMVLLLKQMHLQKEVAVDLAAEEKSRRVKAVRTVRRCFGDNIA